jgi:hypothetical protein
MNIKRNNYRALIPIEKCSMCNITAEEIGESNIHVDHKDYHHSNNEISNLWTLCSYCHSIKTSYEQKLKPEKFWILYLATGINEFKKTLFSLANNYYQEEKEFPKKWNLYLKEINEQDDDDYDEILEPVKPSYQTHISLIEKFKKELSFISKKYKSILVKKKKDFQKVNDIKLIEKGFTKHGDTFWPEDTILKD